MKPRAYLLKAQKYANEHSGCTKVAVGSVIVKSSQIISFGANSTDIPCKTAGCLRQQKYGDNNKTHRNPDDCRAIHSEIQAISRAAAIGKKLEGATIYVTRYPCEACARAIAYSGIDEVVFGRKTNMTTMSLDILKAAGVKIVHESEWEYDDAIN